MFFSIQLDCASSTIQSFRRFKDVAPFIQPLSHLLFLLQCIFPPSDTSLQAPILEIPIQESPCYNNDDFITDSCLIIENGEKVAFQTCNNLVMCAYVPYMMTHYYWSSSQMAMLTAKADFPTLEGPLIQTTLGPSTFLNLFSISCKMVVRVPSIHGLCNYSPQGCALNHLALSFYFLYNKILVKFVFERIEFVS